jgi:iron complex transport system substrate-binding protein
MHRHLILVSLLAAGLLLGACGTAPVEPAVEPAPAEAVSLIDAQGRTITLGQLPQRITIAGRSGLTIADTLFMFPEAQERVVGVVTGRQNVGDFLGYVDPDFEAITQLDVEAGPEQIATTNPDLVLLKNVVSNELGGGLEQIGIPVLYVDLETPEQYRRDLALMGQLLGNEGRAAEIWSFYEARLDRVAQAVGGLADEDKPSVLVAQYNEQGGEVALSVPPATWLQTIEVELAGGRPVWKDAALGGGWQVVNLEQIAAWNPDQIIVISYGEDSSTVVRRLHEDPQWQGLAAVQAGQIYGFPGDIFSWAQPDPRWILGFSWLAGRIHPERFPDLDVMAELRDFFGSLYDMDARAIEDHILPALTGDVKGP